MAEENPSNRDTGSDGTEPVADGTEIRPSPDVESLLDQAEAALRSAGADAGGELPQGLSAFRLEEFSDASGVAEGDAIDVDGDVELNLQIELGRTYIHLDDIMKLRKGSVVPLDTLAGDPVDISVDGRLIARGEVLVLDNHFCVRVTEMIGGTGDT